MAIIELTRITIFGASTRKSQILDGLQDLGCVHLESLNCDPRDTLAINAPAEAHAALKYLKACSEQRRQVRRPEQFDLEQVVEQACANRRRQQALADEGDELRGAIEDLTPWGEFEMPARGEIGGLRPWFYAIPHRDVDKLKQLSGEKPKTELIWQLVECDRQNGYGVVLSQTEPEGVPGQRVDLDPRPLSQLTRRLDEVEEELEELHHQRVGLTRWIDLLTHAMDLADDAAARQCAAGNTLDRPRVFALQGWAPRDEVERLRGFAEEHQLAL